VTLTADSVELVYRVLYEALREYAGEHLHGITCLARGADQIFARAVLALHGTFEVVLPAMDYRERVVAPADRDDFDDLLSRASQVSCMRYARSSPEAYMAASRELIRRSELLLAVWDGQPSAMLGDTADVVRAATERGVPMAILWPRGARRTGPTG
jgi:hypothetical protein